MPAPLKFCPLCGLQHSQHTSEHIEYALIMPFALPVSRPGDLLEPLVLLAIGAVA